MAGPALRELLCVCVGRVDWAASPLLHMYLTKTCLREHDETEQRRKMKGRKI